jgi:hypothetical protein
LAEGKEIERKSEKHKIRKSKPKNGPRDIIYFLRERKRAVESELWPRKRSGGWVK